MLIGYVSDERYVALPDVPVEIESAECGVPLALPVPSGKPNDREAVIDEGKTPRTSKTQGVLSVVSTHSTATGKIVADIPGGKYRVTLNKVGYSAKTVEVELSQDLPYQFRLLNKQLLGYAWPKWVKSGERAEFRVHSPAAYKISLWRYGFKKELVQPLGWFDEHGPEATIQITPDGDYSQSGVEWNRHGFHSEQHRQHVVAPEKSGLYYFHTENEHGEFFSFPWIVAPKSPASKVAVLASNITWNAYNNFGGRSNYISPEGLPARPTINARMELNRYTHPEDLVYDREDYPPLSFDRPEPVNFIPQDETIGGSIEGRAACHLAAAEWRLLGWLEREGFSYDYYAETQLHFDQLPLEEYRVLILSTHPEYWSNEMYRRVKRWVHDEGGRLIYLGGNGIDCDVEFTGGHTCIYKNEDNRNLRGSDSPFESRFHLRQESQANLLGVVYTNAGVMTAAPYKVIDDSHWVFERTGLKNGDLFGTESQHRRIPGGASGHETDKISPHSPEGTMLLAKGTNPDNGGAEMAIYETASGGAVFSVGSICWPSCLLVDAGVSQITRNVVERLQA